MIDKKMNGLIKQLIIMSLTLDLKRMPTEEEIFEEFQITFNEMANMSDEESRCRAFPDYPDEAWKDLAPSKYDMENCGTWPKEEYE